MDSAAFKYKHHYQQQQQQQQQQHFNNSGSNNNNSYHNHNNNNEQTKNSIFILNSTTNSILSNNNSKLFHSDLNENNVVSSSSSSTLSSNKTADASSSMWLSASSTMCSPAAHAIQKLFNCSSTSLKSNQGNYRGIETKSYKTKSELLKKKTKIWKYLEGEESTNIKNNQPGIENETKENLKEVKKKSFKYKTKYWLKSSCESDNQNNQDLAELLEYSCSLCDNCQCMDCQIAYFDCDNSDDSNSEYSFHLSAYEEDDGNDGNEEDKKMELVLTEEKLNKNLISIGDNVCHEMDNKSQDQLEPIFISNYAINQSCQQCLLERAFNHQ